MGKGCFVCLFLSLPPPPPPPPPPRHSIFLYLNFMCMGLSQCDGYCGLHAKICRTHTAHALTPCPLFYLFIYILIAVQIVVYHNLITGGRQETKPRPLLFSEGVWFRGELVQKRTGLEENWFRRELVQKRTCSEGNWFQKGIIGSEGNWFRGDLVSEGNWFQKGTGFRGELVQKGTGFR